MKQEIPFKAAASAAIAIAAGHDPEKILIQNVAQHLRLGNSTHRKAFESFLRGFEQPRLMRLVAGVTVQVVAIAITPPLVPSESLRGAETRRRFPTASRFTRGGERLADLTRLLLQRRPPTVSLLSTNRAPASRCVPQLPCRPRPRDASTALPRLGRLTACDLPERPQRLAALPPLLARPGGGGHTATPARVPEPLALAAPRAHRGAQRGAVPGARMHAVPPGKPLGRLRPPGFPQLRCGSPRSPIAAPSRSRGAQPRCRHRTGSPWSALERSGTTIPAHVAPQAGPGHWATAGHPDHTPGPPPRHRAPSPGGRAPPGGGLGTRSWVTDAKRL